jgi:steroid delta-isomerase-like uncharacterized protein
MTLLATRIGIEGKGKLELIDELIDPSFEGHDPLMGTTKRDGLRESVKSYRAAFPDLKFEVNALVTEGNFVAVRWTARGTHRGELMGIQPTGKSTEVTGIDLAELRNGKIVSLHGQFDALGLMRQIGGDVMALPIGNRPSAEHSKRT